MTVTVSVDATRRLVRFDMEMTFVPSGKVYAHDEILMQEPATPSKGAEIFTGGKPAQQEEGGQVTYGTMFGAGIERDMESVLDETVTIGGVAISFQTLIDASKAFFEKWRQEDIDNPPPPAVLEGSTDERP